MKKLLVVFTTFFFFAALFICTSIYLQTKLFINLHCAHPVQKTAMLKYESYHGSCCWMVGDRKDCWERWDIPCGAAENIFPGYQTTFTVMDYTCTGKPSSFKIPIDLAN